MNGLLVRLSQSFASLGQRDFRYLTFSTAALGFGQWFQQIGLGWLILEVTGSAAQIGGVAFVQGIMLLLASFPAGVLADRYNRRDVLVWSTAIGVFQALALALLVFSDQVQVWHLYAFALIGGLANGISQPVRQAMVYDLTSRELLTNAMTVNSMAQSVARVSGPPVAGMLLGLFGTSSAFFVLSGLKLAAMALTMLIPTQALAQTSRRTESPFASIASGLKYSVRNPLIRALLIITSVGPILVYPYIQFLPIFAKDVLHGGPEIYGLLATGVGWGSLIGLSVLAVVGDVQNKGKVYIISHIAYIGMVLAFAQSESLALSMVFLIGAGICNSLSNVLGNTLFQLACTNEMRGRVMALHSMSGGLQPMGGLPMGFAIERWGASNSVAAFMAFAMALVGVASVLFPQLWRGVLPEEAAASDARLQGAGEARLERPPRNSA